MSNVAAAFCPFVTASDPKLFGFDGGWTDLSKPRDLAKIFDSVEYAKWKSFRESDDARFVALTMPRVLARLPYGAGTKPVEASGYEEGEFDKGGAARAMDHGNYCWMNSAYVMGTKLTDAFAKYGWCVAIRGAEGGGKVEGLPAHVFKSDDGDPDLMCPAEIGITDRREKELSDLGFVPLCHMPGVPEAAFYSTPSAQKPKAFDTEGASANARLSAMLHYMLCVSRFAHYLKVIMRDRVGAFTSPADVQRPLTNWLSNYVASNDDVGPETKARYPLREGKVTVWETPGKPGSYQCTVFLRPHFQLDQLSAGIRLTTQLSTRADA